MATDYYAVLGVRRDASQDEIKKAFRRLARDWTRISITRDAFDRPRIHRVVHEAAPGGICAISRQFPR